MPLVVPGCYQLTINGTTAGRPYSNVFHCEPLGGSPPSVDLAAGIMFDAYTAGFCPAMSSHVSVQSCSYVDLRTLSGDSGTYTPPSPVSGAGSDVANPPNVCYLINWTAPGGRNTRNGRSYIPGVTDAAVDAFGVVDDDYIDDLVTALDTFTDALQVGELALGVVHRTDADSGEIRTITAWAPDAKVATQRRRLRS